jgi:hypothetical protein
VGKKLNGNYIWGASKKVEYNCSRQSAQMVDRLSALCAGHNLLPGRFLLLLSVRGKIDSRAIVRE